MSGSSPPVGLSRAPSWLLIAAPPFRLSFPLPPLPTDRWALYILPLLVGALLPQAGCWCLHALIHAVMHPPGWTSAPKFLRMCVCVCVCVLHGYYPQARNPDSSRNSCWIWNSLSSTDGSTMPPHPRADGPHHSSAETSLPRKPSVPESISSGGFEPTTSDVSRDSAPYLTSRPTTQRC